MELHHKGQVLLFDVTITRECHAFNCTSHFLPEILFFKYDTDGPWYCFSKVEKDLIDDLRAYCIEHYSEAPGYNQLISR